MTKRSCGDCTKCCEGWLAGSVDGKDFYPGRPCHFIQIGKGCSIYPKRPVDPCQTYRCAWLIDENIPEWMKPNAVDAIVDYRKTENGIEYIAVIEAGKKLDSSVLTWVIQHCISHQLNLLWRVDGSPQWIGSSEFNEAMIKSKP